MKIAEIYQSRQGEGRLTGAPSVFIRASGCNLRCWFCDTPYASWKPEGDDQSVEEIVLRTLALDCQHIVITGGEPMLFAELIPLTDKLRAAGRHITIETAGTLYLPVECDLMSISPKLSSSAPPASAEPRWRRRHEQSRHVPDVIRRLIGEYDHQIKFVIDQLGDVEEVSKYLDEFPELGRDRILLMPQGTDAASLAERAAGFEPLCADRGFAFCPRRHIEWYGFVRGA